MMNYTPIERQNSSSRSEDVKSLVNVLADEIATEVVKDYTVELNKIGTFGSQIPANSTSSLKGLILALNSAPYKVRFLPPTKLKKARG